MARGNKSFWYFLLLILLLNLCKEAATNTDAETEENTDIESIMENYLKDYQNVTEKSTVVKTTGDDSDDSDAYVDEDEKRKIEKDTTEDPEVEDTTEASEFEETTDEKDVEKTANGAEREISNLKSFTMATKKESIRDILEGMENSNQTFRIITASLLGGEVAVIFIIVLWMAWFISKIDRYCFKCFHHLSLC
ncbi:hypothetical protein XENTR_v10018176 [Xenopus tropicalis]|nr:hypothetical protein XENTR_v10018176 [Xenopus tropicalis]